MTLQEAFNGIEDYRKGAAKRYGLSEVLVMAVCAILCDCDDWTDVADWCVEQQDWLAKYLHLPNGTPSHDTFSDIFRTIDGDAFELNFRAWVHELVGEPKGVIALDGKTLRGSGDKEEVKNRAKETKETKQNKQGKSAIHLVSAYSTELGITLAHEGSSGKGNELVAIKSLLDTLFLKGTIVTIDALGCQKNIAKQIIDKNADYVLAVKNNQKTLAMHIEEFFITAKECAYKNLPVQQQKKVEKDHGRIETRHAVFVSDVSWMDKDLRDPWAGLGGVGFIEAEVEKGTQITKERRYFIVSKGIKTVAQFANAVRAHWGVESMHWTLDVIFGEDHCRVRCGHGARNLAVARKFALGLFKQDNQFSERSLKRRRKLASRRDSYRESILGFMTIA